MTAVYTAAGTVSVAITCAALLYALVRALLAADPGEDET